MIINAHPGEPDDDGRLQPSGAGEELVRNQITRIVEVGPRQMNERFRRALPKPWNNYFLVNTQWPQGAREGQAQDGAARRLPCNVVDLLWSAGGVYESAGIAKPPCYTMQPRGQPGEELKLRNTTMETFQTSWNGAGSGAVEQASSQSCFNCHGFSGVDFSFVFTDALEEIVPEPSRGR